MKYADIQKELKNKERTLDDIARYTGNIPDKNPNYCLFLGAGCSVTSDIKSGGQLVEEWRRDIFQSIYPGDEYEPTSAKNKLSTEYGAWYDPRNEYSSLFEKKYDLPRQRRMFVESEVADKSPSIGYAYLIKLIEENYFRTAFTTNFDDLLNESFYRFSDKRPITCAHDSSINSITVTSKRPKIIKLHGDFLFDDIKSTLRETESLENNMKNKFIEFSKDYGLIVVGYGGYDRSILDVLTFLLKNEEYFKNGIYWCLRENDEIGTELHKLLWKDRVYYVKIDGFDELFAELNHKLQKQKLPLDTNIMTYKSQNILEQIEDNLVKYQTKSTIITNDIETIKNNIREEQLKILLKGADGKDSKNEKFTDNSPTIENQMLLMRLDGYLDKGDFESFNKDMTNFEELSNGNQSVLRNFHSLKARYHSMKGDFEKSRSVYVTIFDEYGGNPEYLCKAFTVKPDADALSLLDKAIERDPFLADSYYLKAQFLVDSYEENLNKDKVLFDQICQLFKTSVTQNPSLENIAWLKYYNFIFDNKRNSEIPPECIQLYKEAETQNINDLFAVQMKLREMKFHLKDEYEPQSFNYLEETSQKTYGHQKYELNNFQLIWMVDNKYIDQFEEMLEVFKKEYRVSDNLVVAEAKYWGECLGDFKRSKEILEGRAESKFSRIILFNLFKYYRYLEDFEKAEDVFNKYFSGDEKMLYTLLSSQGKWKKIKSLTSTFDINNEVEIIERVFSLMKLNEYEEAKSILRKALDLEGWNNELLIINHEICDYFLKKEKVSKDRLAKLLKISNSDTILIGANALLNKIPEAKKLLKKKIYRDYSMKIHAKRWVIWDIKHCKELKEIVFDKESAIPVLNIGSPG